MSLSSRSWAPFAVLLAITAGFVNRAAANDGSVPAIPCYKCVGNGVVTDPSSTCKSVNTEAWMDVGSTHCTTSGWEDGSTSCETTGQICVWVGWIGMTGTGIPAPTAGIVEDPDLDIVNCRGQVLAWAEGRTGSAALAQVVL